MPLTVYAVRGVLPFTVDDDLILSYNNLYLFIQENCYAKVDLPCLAVF